MKNDTKRGTCPVCFGKFDTTEASIGKHGWKEFGGRQVGVYGQAVHSGECFGLGYKPFELSSEGTVAYLETRLVPYLASVERALTHLATRPTLLVAKSQTWQERQAKKPEEMIELTFAAMPREYESVLARKVRDREEEKAAVEADIARFQKLVAEWAPGTLADKVAKVETVHLEITDRAGRQVASCATRRMFGRPQNLKKTTNKAAVTCSRCLKSMASDAAYVAKRDGEVADAEALVAWLKANGQATSKVIKAALTWDTKRFNRAVDRAGYQKVKSGWESPTVYSAV